MIWLARVLIGILIIVFSALTFAPFVLSSRLSAQEDRERAREKRQDHEGS